MTEKMFLSMMLVFAVLAAGTVATVVSVGGNAVVTPNRRERCDAVCETAGGYLAEMRVSSRDYECICAIGSDPE